MSSNPSTPQQFGSSGPLSGKVGGVSEAGASNAGQSFITSSSEAFSFNRPMEVITSVNFRMRDLVSLGVLALSPRIFLPNRASGYRVISLPGVDLGFFMQIEDWVFHPADTNILTAPSRFRLQFVEMAPWLQSGGHYVEGDNVIGAFFHGKIEWSFLPKDLSTLGIGPRGNYANVAERMVTGTNNTEDHYIDFLGLESSTTVQPSILVADPLSLTPPTVTDPAIPQIVNRAIPLVNIGLDGGSLEPIALASIAGTTAFNGSASVLTNGISIPVYKRAGWPAYVLNTTGAVALGLNGDWDVRFTGQVLRMVPGSSWGAPANQLPNGRFF